MINERLERGYRFLEERGLAERVRDGYQLTPAWAKAFPLYFSAAQARGMPFMKAAEEGTKDALLSRGSVSEEELDCMIDATLYLSRNLRVRFE